MIDEKIKALLEERLKEDDLKEFFITEISQNNTKLEVYVDSAGPMSYAACTKISRFLESHLDENLWLGEKYILEVSSPGATKPLVDRRQYKKHLGRKVKLKTKNDELYEGRFVELDEEKLVVAYIEVEKIGKKKIKNDINKEILLDDIAELKIVVGFK